MSLSRALLFSAAVASVPAIWLLPPGISLPGPTTASLPLAPYNNTTPTLVTGNLISPAKTSTQEALKILVSGGAAAAASVLDVLAAVLPTAPVLPAATSASTTGTVSNRSA